MQQASRKRRREAAKAYWTPERRAQQSITTKIKMADPAVRDRIRAGMRAANIVGEQKAALCRASNAACADARRQFLAEFSLIYIDDSSEVRR